MPSSFPVMAAAQTKAGIKYIIDYVEELKTEVQDAVNKGQCCARTPGLILNTSMLPLMTLTALCYRRQR